MKNLNEAIKYHAYHLGRLFIEVGTLFGIVVGGVLVGSWMANVLGPVMGFWTIPIFILLITVVGHLFLEVGKRRHSDD
jgi:hypothetical protein